MTSTRVEVVVPAGIDDPHRPSGGNVYDRRICRGLADLGWQVAEHPVPGAWPRPEASAREVMTGTLAALPAGSVVLVDGLVGSAAPAELTGAADRLRLVVLVHLPLGCAVVAEGAAAPQVAAVRDAERRALAGAAAVVATSRWTQAWLRTTYGLPAALVDVVEPGVDPAPRTVPGATGGRLLCVGALSPVKGQDLLVTALAVVADLSWDCRCAGSLAVAPGFADAVRRRAAEAGLADRIGFPGPMTGPTLAAAYAATDLLVLPSRAETYGMVAAEALARGIPVLATAVGGVPDTVGRAGDGTVPGMLVPAEDPAALAAAVRGWLGDRDLRGRLRQAALARGAELTGWQQAAHRMAAVLAGVASR